MASKIGKSHDAAKAKHLKKAKKLLEENVRAQDISDRGMKIDYQGPAGDQAGPQFPARYQYRDDRDDKMRIKAQLASDARPAPLTDEDVQMIMDKRAQREVYNLDEFFANQWGAYDAKNPANLRWAQEIHPDFYARREALIEEQAAQQARLAKLALRGPRDLDDVKLLKQIKDGVYVPPKQPIWKLGDEPSVRSKGDHFQRGLFNPIRARLYETPTSAGGGITNMSPGIYNIAGTGGSGGLGNAGGTQAGELAGGIPEQNTGGNLFPI